MKDKTIAILESRGGGQIAALVEKYGGTPVLAPALAEIPEAEPARIEALIRSFAASPPAIFIFQTGVGTRALFDTADSLKLTPALLQVLEQAHVVARGPKPAAVLRARKVRIDYLAGEPFTTSEVLSGLRGIGLHGKCAAVQRYGETNRELQAALEHAGAQVIEIATYRWAVPQNKTPLLNLIDALSRSEADAVMFTSAVQAANLFAVAREAGKEQTLAEGLARTLVASVGPVCTAKLKSLGVRVDVEAKPPKLGALVEALNIAFGAGAPPSSPAAG
jgi:uroporphyrinogen-III synthase